MKEKRGDAFSDCHPAVNFFWFAAVILITMLNSHPVFLGISSWEHFVMHPDFKAGREY